MKLEFPHCLQESEYDCGPANLLMLCQYFNQDKKMADIKELMDYRDGEAIYTIEIATIASELGLKAEFFTADPFADHEGEFYEEHSREKTDEELYREADEAGVEVEQLTFTMDELLEKISENTVPVVLIDWHTLKDKDEGYQGHFVPIVGYNDSEVIFHDASDEEGDFLKADRERFDEARKAEGTDQDVAFISRD